MKTIKTVRSMYEMTGFLIALKKEMTKFHYTDSKVMAKKIL